MSSGSLPAILLLAGFGFGAAYLIKHAQDTSRDSQGRPINDSFGQAIDYSHNIAYIPDTKDPVIIAQAIASWRLEERIKKENAAKQGLTYIEKPFKLSDYYGARYNRPAGE